MNVSPIIRSRRFFLATLVALALCAGVGYAAIQPDETEVVGLFQDASPLEVGSEVRSSGVKVGEVRAIELEGKHARVVLDVNEEVLPLHSDARMAIRPINLLGENFVEVSPGSPEKPVLTGPVPQEQTSTIVTLQAVLDTFDDPTSAGLAALVSELGTGLAGHGDELAATLKALAPAMQDIDTLGDLLRQQNAALNQLVEVADPVARAVSGPEGRRLDALVSNARTTLDALAAERAGVEQTVQELPSTLAEARRTLDALDTVASSVAPTLRKARPVTSDLEQISRELVTFSEYATPAFASFDKVFAHADRLLAQAAPAVRQLRHAGPSLERAVRNARPIADQLVDQHLGDLMAFVRKWALSTNSRDNISHYFRGVVHITPGALNAMLGVKAVPEVLQPGGDGTGDSTGILPDLPGLGIAPLDEALTGEKGLLSGLGGLLGGGLTGSRSSRATEQDANSATGLTSQQEHQLLTQLLGGAS